MKVLVQNSLFHPNIIGGAEISSHLIGMELRRRGVEADAVASTGIVGRGASLTTRPTADGLGTVYEAPAHGFCDILPSGEAADKPGLPIRGLHHVASIYSPRWKRLFGEVIDRARPDVIHTNTIVGLTPAIWSVARERGIPVVHTLRDYHLLCPRTTLLRSDNTDCKTPPIPCRILARFKLAQTGGLQYVTGPSRHVLQKHLDAGGFPGASTRVVPNALEELPTDVPPPESTGAVRGLFLGQINTHKGIPVLLEALAGLFADPECSALSFDFAGAGPLVASVEAFCATHPTRVRYHGVVTDEPKRNLLRQASFMVVPSIWAEPFSRSIIDGFSWGLPAIGSDQGGIPEVITDGCDGLVVAPESESLRAAMRRYTLDGEERAQHALAARRRAEDFTLDRQIDTFMEIYATLVD